MKTFIRLVVISLIFALLLVLLFDHYQGFFMFIAQTFVCSLFLLFLAGMYVWNIKEGKENDKRRKIRESLENNRIFNLELKARKGDLVAYEEWKERTGRNDSSFFFFWW